MTGQDFEPHAGQDHMQQDRKSSIANTLANRLADRANTAFAVDVIHKQLQPGMTSKEIRETYRTLKEIFDRDHDTPEEHKKALEKARDMDRKGIHSPALRATSILSGVDYVDTTAVDILDSHQKALHYIHRTVQ